MRYAIKATMDRYINYEMAIAGAVFLGGTVFAINYSHGVGIALVAAAKQATYTFFAAGFITRHSENLAVRLDNRALSLLMSVVISTSIAVGLTYLVHSLRGTPEPVRSTLPTLAASPLAFLIAGVRRQRRDAAEAAGGHTEPPQPPLRNGRRQARHRDS